MTAENELFCYQLSASCEEFMLVHYETMESDDILSRPLHFLDSLINRVVYLFANLHVIV